MFRRRQKSVTRLIATAALTCALGGCATIFDSGITFLSASSPTQFGRLDHNGITSDWSGAKAFPGVRNTTSSFHYATYTISDPYYQYIQVDFDDVSGTALDFVSAYLNSYTPSGVAPLYGLNVNYLGDPGSVGNLYGIDPQSFQVFVPAGSYLQIVVEDTSTTGAGVGQPYDITVEGFTDTLYDDAVPEPATFALIASSLGIGTLCARLRKLRRSA